MITRNAWRWAVALPLLMAISGQAGAQPAENEGRHLGVASCAGGNCHGAVERLKGSSVEQNEYLTWSHRDKHSKAYSVLLEERSLRIARNLGLPDAKTSELCLNCHADNVPQNRRGPTFQITDGVGCEACHGGAEKWLGEHISGASHQRNLERGMYPTNQPAERAVKCLSCHFGVENDANKFVTHRIMGAGHPYMGFELDTYTAAQPAHFTVDETYVKRKGPVNDVQVWALGQAVGLVKHMDALIDPQHGPKAVFPELVLFDCQSCHHAMTQLRWEPRSSTRLPPGSVDINDAYGVMLRVIAARVAPEAGKSLSQHLLALHHATTEGWAAVQREAGAVRKAAEDLMPALSSHNFTRDDMKALMEGVIAVAPSGDDARYSGAAQVTMGLSSIVAAMKSLEFVTADQAKAMNNAMNPLYDAVAHDEVYQPATFVSALQQFKKSVPQ
jgi:hypothetical protein